LSTFFPAAFFFVFVANFGQISAAEIKLKKCPCHGALADYVSVTGCSAHEDCTLDYTEADYDELMYRFNRSRPKETITKEKLKQYFAPACIEFFVNSSGIADVAIAAYDPLKIMVVPKSQARELAYWAPKTFGEAFKLRYCGLRDTRVNFRGRPCETHSHSEYKFKNCQFLTHDERFLPESAASRMVKFDGFLAGLMAAIGWLMANG